MIKIPARTMKYFSFYSITLLLLFFITITVHAQDEYLIQWTDNSKSISANGILADKQGNFYLLGALYDFNPKVFSVEGISDNGNVIIKIDSLNNILWEKAYTRETTAPAGFQIFDGRPASTLLFIGDS